MEPIIFFIKTAWFWKFTQSY